jgi:hypothetical protein
LPLLGSTAAIARRRDAGTVRRRLQVSPLSVLAARRSGRRIDDAADLVAGGEACEGASLAIVPPTCCVARRRQRAEDARWSALKCPCQRIDGDTGQGLERSLRQSRPGAPPVGAGVVAAKDAGELDRGIERVR